MHQYLIIYCFFGVLFLSACRAGNVPQDITPTLLYIQENMLIEQSGDNPPKELNLLPEAGEVLAAIKDRQTILVLRERGIQRLNLDDGIVDMVFQFDVLAQYGDLLLASDSSRIFFSVVVSDATSEFGSATLIGYYDLVQDLAKTVSYFPQTIRLLGLAQDRLGLYLLPLGQDPDLGFVYLYDFQKNEISRELSIRGTGYASLAPDSRLLAVAAFRVVTNNDYSLEPILNLYDLLFLPLTSPLTFTAPDPVGKIDGLLWSQDSSVLYFQFLPDDYEFPAKTSYGLWRLTIETSEMSQVAVIADPAFHVISINSKANWVLLTHESKDEAILISLPDGKSQSITLPVLATFVGWQ